MALIIKMKRREGDSGDVLIEHGGEVLCVRVTKGKEVNVGFDGPESFIVRRRQPKEGTDDRSKDE